MEITQLILTINGGEQNYASKCPEGQNLSDFLAKIVHDLLFTAKSQINVPAGGGEAGLIDKNTVTGINVIVVK